jgi:hypothetical protein
MPNMTISKLGLIFNEKNFTATFELVCYVGVLDMAAPNRATMRI